MSDSDRGQLGTERMLSQGKRRMWARLESGTQTSMPAGAPVAQSLLPSVHPLSGFLCLALTCPHGAASTQPHGVGGAAVPWLHMSYLTEPWDRASWAGEQDPGL